MPVYGVEKYIKRSLDSILLQTFPDFELLCIDDGSLDRSGKICDEYAETDFRIKVIHKENGGVASARQCGLDNAIGEYIVSVDPDDWIECDMLEEMYNAIGDADMLICDTYQENETGQLYQVQKPTDLTPKAVLDDILFYRLWGTVWNKMIKREFFIRNNVHFKKGQDIGEDYLMCIQLLRNTDIKVEYLPKAFYHYNRHNPNSYMSVFDKSLADKTYDFIQEVKKLDLIEEYKNLITQLAIDSFRNNAYTSIQYYKKFRAERKYFIRCDEYKLTYYYIYLSACGIKSLIYSLYKFRMLFAKND
ncbi:MAG: glycosyltransferase [Bacteroidales bacterium]|nr:glycosyltransferase [Bacteroidales bacterium]